MSKTGSEKSSKKDFEKCIICDEKINLSTHKLVECPYCNFEACRKCNERYILDKSVAQCMNTSCSKEWTPRQMLTIFTKSFINNDWRNNREKILLDREIALLPMTQHAVLEEIRKEEVTKEIQEINLKIKELENYRSILLDSFRKKIKDDKVVFMRPCSDSDCRGFLSTHWKCGICNKYTCSECNLIKTKNVEHICNPDDVASAKLLSKDTKHCPKCSIGIYKIDGCDQMWCTQCHTAFSWKTGKIENNIHNPHYYEWLRRNGNEIQRNPGDIPCGRQLDHNVVTSIYQLFANYYGKNFLKDNTKTEKIYYLNISELVRSCIHIQYTVFPRYRVNDVDKNLQLRINYMRKRMDLEDFKRLVHLNNKKNEKHREIYDIFNLLINTISEIIFRILQNIRSTKACNFEFITNTLDESKAICDYANECFLDISKIYNSKEIIVSITDKYRIAINGKENTD